MAAVASIAPCAPRALAGPSVASRNVVGQNAQLGMPLRARQCQTLRVSRRPFGVKTVSTEVLGEEKIGHGSRIEISSSSLFVGTGVHASSSSVFFSIDRSSLVKQVIGSQRRPARRQSLVVRGLFGLGVPELAVIAGVAAILFGPKKLPEIGKSLGKTVKSFQQAAKEFETAVKTGADPTATESAEPETRVTPTSEPPPPTPTTTSTPSEKESV